VVCSSSWYIYCRCLVLLCSVYRSIVVVIIIIVAVIAVIAVVIAVVVVVVVVTVSREDR
jgi:hypothetical protein